MSLVYPRWVTLIRELHRINKVICFKLVFLLETLDPLEIQQDLVEALELVTAKGLVDFLDLPPTICITQPHYFEWYFTNPQPLYSQSCNHTVYM